VHKFNILKPSYHFLKNFLARWAHSIAFYPPLRNESMQCALPTPFNFFSFFEGSLSLTDSFQNSLKTRINCIKLRIKCPKIACGGGRKGGGGDMRMGEEHHGCWGDRCPWFCCIDFFVICDVSNWFLLRYYCLQCVIQQLLLHFFPVTVLSYNLHFLISPFDKVTSADMANLLSLVLALGINGWNKPIWRLTVTIMDIKCSVVSVQFFFVTQKPLPRTTCNSVSVVFTPRALRS